MNTEQKENELNYQLVKLILHNLEKAGLLSPTEVSVILKEAQQEFASIIGALD